MVMPWAFPVRTLLTTPSSSVKLLDSYRWKSRRDGQWRGVSVEQEGWTKMRLDTLFSFLSSPC